MLISPLVCLTSKVYDQKVRGVIEQKEKKMTPTKINELRRRVNGG